MHPCDRSTNSWWPSSYISSFLFIYTSSVSVFRLQISKLHNINTKRRVSIRRSFWASKVFVGMPSWGKEIEDILNVQARWTQQSLISSRSTNSARISSTMSTFSLNRLQWTNSNLSKAVPFLSLWSLPHPRDPEINSKSTQHLATVKFQHP